MSKIKISCVLALTVVWNVFVLVKNDSAIYTARHFPGLDDLFIEDQYFLREIENISKLECSKFCSEDLQCISFFYNELQIKCRLHSSGWYNPQEGAAASNWTYHVLGEKGCPVHSGFIHDRFYGMCVHLSTDFVNGTAEGESYCASKESSMITFSDATKIPKFTSTMNKHNPTFLDYNANGNFQAYIGLFYSSGTWLWSDGTALSSDTNWGPTQPNSPASIKCVAVSFKPSVNIWQWNDISCNRFSRVLCEIPH
ncbi:Lactose-binding lectin l-2-like [Mactra antiquata]